MRAVAAASLAAVMVVVGGCGGDDESAPTTTLSLAAEDCVARPPTLRVDLIAPAIAAVELELGGPQQYFEINATDVLVNLFVAVADGTQVQPFVYLQGELNSQDPASATGFTFASGALDFDPQTITSCVTDELDTSVPSLFDVVAGEDGAIDYSVVVDSSAGGQLFVSLNPAGQILAVDPTS